MRRAAVGLGPLLQQRGLAVAGRARRAWPDGAVARVSRRTSRARRTLLGGSGRHSGLTSVCSSGTTRRVGGVAVSSCRVIEVCPRSRFAGRCGKGWACVSRGGEHQAPRRQGRYRHHPGARAGTLDRGRRRVQPGVDAAPTACTSPPGRATRDPRQAQGRQAQRPHGRLARRLPLAPCARRGAPTRAPAPPDSAALSAVDRRSGLTRTSPTRTGLPAVRAPRPPRRARHSRTPRRARGASREDRCVSPRNAP